eukprot:m.162128 g.162128  ORF g.162128 m.162128 type:complete len:450 (+) comp15196_c0_seq5:63-1412(+)
MSMVVYITTTCYFVVVVVIVIIFIVVVEFTMGDIVVVGHAALPTNGSIGESLPKVRIEIAGGIIKKITALDEEDQDFNEKIIEADIIVPGFVDIHNHGFGGDPDLSYFWCNPEYTLSRLPRLGTTSMLASLVFDKDPGRKHDAKNPKFWEMFHKLERLLGKCDTNNTVVEGIHAEGPVVGDLGALPDGEHTKMSSDTFQKLVEDLLPSLKIMTIGPSVDATDNFSRIKHLCKSNVVPSLGHDRDCNEEQILGALRASSEYGKRCHVTHLFNVSSFSHRSPSLANFGMLNSFPKLPGYEGLRPPTVEIITDFAHVHPLTVSALLQTRDPLDVACITDAVLEPKKGASLLYDDRELVVSDDLRTVVVKGSGRLAGSCCSLLDAFKNLVNVMNISINKASAMLSGNPSRIAGLTHIGSLEVGKRADILLLSSAPELKLTGTVINGKLVFMQS